MTNDLVPIGAVFAESGYFLDAKDQAKALVKIMAGRSLGLSEVASMTGINIIKGKLSLESVTMAAILKGRGKYDYRIREHSNTQCKIEFFEGPARDGDSLGISEFSLEDAKTAGLFERNPNYKKYPRNMLFARAMSNGIKWFCPDTFGCSAYTPGEMDAGADEDGEIIEGIAQEVEMFEKDLEEFNEFKAMVLELKELEYTLPGIYSEVVEEFGNGYDMSQISQVLKNG